MGETAALSPWGSAPLNLAGHLARGSVRLEVMGLKGFDKVLPTHGKQRWREGKLPECTGRWEPVPGRRGLRVLLGAGGQFAEAVSGRELPGLVSIFQERKLPDLWE